MEFRTAYGPRNRVALSFDGELSRTKQSFKDECDINMILKKFLKTGMMSHIGKPGFYADLPEGDAYRDSLHNIILAKSKFELLSSGIRTRFDNDVAKFLDFVADPGNLEEMYTLGLAVRPVVVPEAPAAVAGASAAPTT